jgi:dTDP-4-amino-4,6-dideoxygalactose transaminase
VANALWENEISLPIFFGLDEEKTNTVIQAVINSYQEVLGS